MKKTISCVAFLAIILMLSSCNKAVDPLVGDYSYKTSGSVSVQTATDTTTHQLNETYGQMNIINLHSDDSIMIVMNEWEGKVYTVKCIAHEGGYVIPQYVKHVQINGLSSINNKYDVYASGTATIYDKKTIVINETYTGIIHPDFSDTALVEGNSILTIAQRN